MKKIKKSEPPKEFIVFISRNPVGSPNHSWKALDDDRMTKKALQRQLFNDQKGLCAYCEIDLSFTPANAGGDAPKGDFQIEHFHPQSDKCNPSKDWVFDWMNLMGICTGGTETKLIDKSHVASGKLNYHCGSRKGNKILDDKILNPLLLPAFPNFFMEDTERGTEDKFFLSPNKSLSPTDYAKAQNTLQELNLNCDLLAKFRRSTIKRWIDEVTKLTQAGQSVDDAIEQVMEMAFDSTKSTWPSFFSSIRSFFGVAAEKRLRKIQYDG